ncbi:hypothetical protein D3C86_1195500 [compost metagenome]
MEFQAEVALELRFQLGAEGWVAVQARHLVLVLVGHQLGVAARHHRAQAQLGVGAEQGAFGGGHFIHQRAEAAGVGGVLVVGEQQLAVGDQLVEVLDGAEFLHLGATAEQLAQALRIGAGQATEAEGGQVHRYGDAVQFDGALQRFQAQRDQPGLPGVAHQQDVGADAVAEGALRQALRVAQVEAGFADGVTNLFQQPFGLQVGVRVAHELGGRQHMAVGDHLGAAVLDALQGVGGGGHHQVAGEQGVGLLGVDAYLVEALRHVGQAHEGQHRAAFLGEAHEVEHAGRLEFQVGGHGDQRADGDHAGAADAGDQQVIGRVPHVGRRTRQVVQQFGQGALASLGLQGADALAHAAALDRDEARAEAVDAGVVLVARRLVELALAAQFGLQRHQRQAVGGHAAVAAAFAYGLVDEQAAIRVGEFALLAAAALLGGAGLFVDQYGDA